MKESPVKIGVSACYWEGDPSKVLFNGRPLLFLEKSMADYLSRSGCLVLMIPFFHSQGLSSSDYARELDGLVLQGGVDVSPSFYGEKPLKPEWAGDSKRDLYESELVKAFFHKNKPVLGICRGMQLLNVSFGGSLYQDIQLCIPNSFQHRDPSFYELNHHEIDLVSGSSLSSMYGGALKAMVNSVHHQALKDLAKGFKVEAYSCNDGVIEAIKMHQNDPNDPYCYGVQWHPEFQAVLQQGFLDPDILLRDFLDAVRHRHLRKGKPP